MSSPFIEIAHDAIEADCRTHPGAATSLGNHRYDDRLDDLSPAGAAAEAAQSRALLARLDALDDRDFDEAERADGHLLRANAERTLFELTELDEASWNPMVHNPGEALYALLARDFAPLPDRLASVAGRLSAVEDYFEAARERLTDLSAVHTETAIAQLDGTSALIRNLLPELAREAAGPDLSAVAGRAATAIEHHQEWLRQKLPDAGRAPQLGADLYRRELALTLATPWPPDELLAQAYRDLDRVEHELAELVSQRTGVAVGSEQIAGALNELGRDAPTSASILSDCRAALIETTAFVEQHDLLSLQHDPVEIIEMPEIDRGVAVAYCRAVGALETADLPTQFAVSPTPADWSPERVRSFYREYNRHMLHDLTIHEAMPGHVEQLSHARRYRGATAVRSVYGSDSFIEGWAVYAEELMADQGYRSEVSDQAAFGVRMQQLKMQLRCIVNTILDISFHTEGLDEAAAMQLMTGRGYQEDGEAAGKWRRVQLTSTQLCTYYVGYLEIRALVADLKQNHPNWSLRQVHDTVLGAGSPPVVILRPLLGLPAIP